MKGYGLPVTWAMITGILAGFGVPPDVADAAKTIADNGTTVVNAGAAMVSAATTIVTFVQTWRKNRSNKK